MPASTRTSAPASRVYSSATPSVQTKLKPLKKRTYSRHSIGSTRLSRQQTLTQIDFLDVQSSRDIEQEIDEYEQEVREKAHQRKRRRRTEGDQPVTHYTQTLTQIDFVSTPRDAQDSEDDTVQGHDDLGHSSDEHGVERSGKGKPLKAHAGHGIENKAPMVNSLMAPPSTPHSKLGRFEIPSTQSPATPLSVQKPVWTKSPLSGKSVNIQSSKRVHPFSYPRRADKPELKIEDTFDEESQIIQTQKSSPSPSKVDDLSTMVVEDTFDDESQVLQTPDKSIQPSSPAGFSKSVRFADSPGVQSDSETASPQTIVVIEVPRKQEIEDSEAESDDDASDIDYIRGSERLDESCANDVITKQGSSQPRDVEEPNESKKPFNHEKGDGSPEAHDVDDLEEYAELGLPETCYDELGLETQLEVIRTTALTEHQLAQPSEIEPSVQLSQTQHIRESQSERLSTQDFEIMGPRSDRSDIFISIRPEDIVRILSRQKTHDFRNYSIPRQVSRLWFYETSPKSRVRYMATIGPCQMPGEIPSKGFGNASFNTCGKNQLAYEIVQLYELANPVSLHSLKANNWLKGPPTRYIYLRPAVLGQLLANIVRPLFSDKPLSSQPFGSDSQAATAQLQSTMLQFTQVEDQNQMQQVHSSSPRIDPESSRVDSAIRPSQATTADITQASPYVRGEASMYLYDEDENVVLVPDSPVGRIASTQKSSTHSLPSHQHNLHESVPVPFTLPSSQLLTRSQMLPDSLFSDSILPPHIFIEDSEEEF